MVEKKRREFVCYNIPWQRDLCETRSRTVRTIRSETRSDVYRGNGGRGEGPNLSSSVIRSVEGSIGFSIKRSIIRGESEST